MLQEERTIAKIGTNDFLTQTLDTLEHLGRVQCLGSYISRRDVSRSPMED